MTEIPRIAWSDFLPAFRWRQGEHVTIIGPTDAGKSTIATAILPRRRYVLALIVKPSDPDLRKMLRRDGYVIARRWRDVPPIEAARRVAFWPPIDKPEQIVEQRAAFLAALKAAYVEKGWCVYADELEYLSSHDYLGLDPLVRLHLQHGRTLGISFVSSAQRPARIPLAAYSMARHLFFFQSNDDVDLKRLRELGGRVDKKRLQQAIVNLDFDAHEVLYLDARRGAMVITRVEL